MNASFKTPLVCALASLMSLSAQAADPLTVYGKLNVSLQSNDEADGTSTTKVQSNASRLGVKGDLLLRDSLSVFYWLEYEVNTGDDKKDNFEARNQFVGLKGNFGAVAMGRNDTMLKQSQGKIDQFNDLSGDIKHLFKGENRIEQTVTYLSPSYYDVKLGVTYAAEGASSQYQQDGYSVAAMYGDGKLKQTRFFASVAYDSDVKGYKVLRTTLQGKIANLTLGGMFQRQEETYDSDGNSVDGDNKNGYLASAAYKIDNLVLKGQYQDMEDKGHSWSAGVDYKLAQPTKIFAFYTSRDLDKTDRTDDFFGLGLEHKF